MPFLEADHLAENNNAIAVRTVPESELRSARGITWARFFTIEPAVDVTAVAAEIVRGFHALHFSPARCKLFSAYLSIRRLLRSCKDCPLPRARLLAGPSS